ncbi:hypothetical protein P0Y35_06170 [Kiritimatiellaeota bacterium B1221]|nr:hypothetical protein [Kiritimatiellaeota bacterium B1221]
MPTSTKIKAESNPSTSQILRPDNKRTSRCDPDDGFYANMAESIDPPSDWYISAIPRVTAGGEIHNPYFYNIYRADHVPVWWGNTQNDPW